MPSSSFRSFTFNLVDVDRLRQAYGLLNNGYQGRKGLGHITRSGVVMLCAAWERYCEGLVRESARSMCEQLDDPLTLPLDVQKEISKAVKSSPHELRPLHLSGDGWKQVYFDHANNLTAALNTPKSGKLNGLFKRLTGLPKLSSGWTRSDSAICRGDQ